MTSKQNAIFSMVLPVLLVLSIRAIDAWPNHQAHHKSKRQAKRKLVEVVQCLRVSSEKPNHTGLNCGINEKGEEQIIDVPEWYATFKGDLFRMNFYADGTNEFAQEQPKNSFILYAPPCLKRPTSVDYRREAAQQKPCNPELVPQ